MKDENLVYLEAKQNLEMSLAQQGMLEILHISQEVFYAQRYGIAVSQRLPWIHPFDHQYVSVSRGARSSQYLQWVLNLTIQFKVLRTMAGKFLCEFEITGLYGYNTPV